MPKQAARASLLLAVLLSLAGAAAADIPTDDSYTRHGVSSEAKTSGLAPGCYSPLGLAIYFNGGGSPDCRAALAEPFHYAPSVSPMRYAEVYLLTCLLELAFYLWAVRGRRGLTAVAICNLATHPVVYFALPALSARCVLSYAAVMAAGEIFAPAAEAALLIRFWNVPPRRAVPAMIAANLFSWWAGVYLA